MTFGRRLQVERCERGFSQASLAGAAGLHRTEISLLERGLRDPRLETLVLLSRALGDVTPGEMVEWGADDVPLRSPRRYAR
jgi:transcriptional regulator with XRE-family HTH domain